MSSALTDLMHDSTEDLTLRTGFTDAVMRGGRRRQLRARTAVMASTGLLTLACVAAVADPLFGGSSANSSAVQYADGGVVPPTQQLQTFCLLPEGGRLDGTTDLIGPTGDPVDNCARFWRYARNTEPPALVAYQDRFGQVLVQAQSVPLPAGALLLPRGVVQDPEAIELAEVLGDQIALGPGHCRDRSAALTDTKRLVGALGLRDWPVVVDDTRTNPAVQQCWASGPNTRKHVVTVVAIDGGFDYPPALEQIAKPLRAASTGCWDRARAISEVRAAVAASGLKEEFKRVVEIREVDVPGARCTIVRMGGGGGVQFTLRGPA